MSCCPFSRWVSLACRFFSFSLSFSCSIFQICGHDNNTLENTDTETISAFRFRLYWLFNASTLQNAGGYTISRQNNLELHLGRHECWLSYFTLVCLWCRRTVGRTVTWLPNVLVSVDYHIFLPMVLHCARFARENSARQGSDKVGPGEGGGEGGDSINSLIMMIIIIIIIIIKIINNNSNNNNQLYLYSTSTE